MNAPLATKVRQQRATAQHIESVHPMAPEAIDARNEGRKAYARSDKLAHQMWRDITGQDLPDQVAFTDSKGDLWVLQAHVELRLVQKGELDG